MSFTKAIADFINSIRWTNVIAIFLLYAFLQSDIYQEFVLASFDGTMRDNQVTLKGVAISGIILSLAYIINNAINY